MKINNPLQSLVTVLAASTLAEQQLKPAVPGSSSPGTAGPPAGPEQHLGASPLPKAAGTRAPRVALQHRAATNGTGADSTTDTAGSAVKFATCGVGGILAGATIGVIGSHAGKHLDRVLDSAPVHAYTGALTSALIAEGAVLTIALSTEPNVDPNIGKGFACATAGLLGGGLLATAGELLGHAADNSLFLTGKKGQTIGGVLGAAVGTGVTAAVCGSQLRESNVPDKDAPDRT